MTKENFTNKWAFPYNINGAINPYFVADLKAVIATEIAKVRELETVQGIPQPEPTEQPAKPFDRQRFEAIYLAVVAGGQHIDDLMATENTIKLLDDFYAEKEKGGNNG